MSQAPLSEWLFVAGIFFAAGIVKGVLGMGLPTLAMGLLGLIMSVPQAAGLLVLPSFVTNLWQALAGGALRALARRLWRLQLGIAAGVALGAWLPAPDAHTGRELLGSCLLVYGCLGLAGWRSGAPSPRMHALLGPAAGAATGVVTALTGVFVIPAVPYLQSLQLDRHQLSQALGLSFTTSTVALGALLAARGELGAAASLNSALALVPALAGMYTGQKLRQAMSEAAFRRCFFIGLALLGVWLLAR